MAHGSDKRPSIPMSCGRRWRRWPKGRASRRANSGSVEDRHAAAVHSERDWGNGARRVPAAACHLLLARKAQVARTNLVAPLELALLIVAFERDRATVSRSAHAN